MYPLLLDETCWFLAVDFDKKTWQEDSRAFMDTCRELNVPAALERSRSGNGGHVWIFFDRAIPAITARKLGCVILARAMERRHQLGLDSYDRFFPSQDTMPKGGFGNLIALPLQAVPRKAGNSVFVDSNFQPYPDQWGFLAAVQRVPMVIAERIVTEAERKGDDRCPDQRHGRRVQTRSLDPAAIPEVVGTADPRTVAGAGSDRSCQPRIR